MFQPASPTLASSELNTELLNIWLSRYLPDLGLISHSTRSLVEERLGVIISVDRRKETQTKLLSNLSIDCTMAAIQAQNLIAESGQVLQLIEAKELSLQICKVYEALLLLYVEDFVFSPVLGALHTLDTPAGKRDAAAEVMPAFSELMRVLTPLLVNLQAVYATSRNRRAIGFVTTQLHLTRQRLVDRLDAYERIWVKPYLRLIEDFVCMPWLRICAAAGQASPEQLEMAKLSLVRSDAIATQVYQKALRAFPNHISRQGRIHSAAVEHSSLRDLNMFQAYIWLCVLENNLSAVEDELLPLCILVFPCAQVKWTFVVQGVRWLIEEIKTDLNPMQQQSFALIAAPLERLFVAANPDSADINEISANLKLRFAL